MYHMYTVVFLTVNDPSFLPVNVVASLPPTFSGGGAMAGRGGALTIGASGHVSAS